MKHYDPARDHDPLFSVTLIHPPACYLPTIALHQEHRASVKFGACPGHAIGNGRLTGLVVQGEHLAWRHHTKRTISGAELECSASGQRVCDLPARETAQHTGPACTCHSAHAAVSRDLAASSSADTDPAKSAPQTGAQR